MVRRTLRAIKAVAHDERLPSWLRGLVLVGLLPWPGPVDEIVLTFAAAAAWIGYRHVIREAWEDAAT